MFLLNLYVPGYASDFLLSFALYNNSKVGVPSLCVCVSVCGLILGLPGSHSCVIAALQADGCQGTASGQGSRSRERMIRAPRGERSEVGVTSNHCAFLRVDTHKHTSLITVLRTIRVAAFVDPLLTSDLQRLRGTFLGMPAAQWIFSSSLCQ